MTTEDVGKGIYNIRIKFLRYLDPKMPPAQNMLEYKVNVMATTSEAALAIAENQLKEEWPNAIIAGINLGQLRLY